LQVYFILLMTSSQQLNHHVMQYNLNTDHNHLCLDYWCYF